MVSSFEKASKLEIPYSIVGRRAGDIAECYADPTKARDELNWTATKSLSDMCIDTNRFLQNKLNFFDNQGM